MIIKFIPRLSKGSDFRSQLKTPDDLLDKFTPPGYVSEPKPAARKRAARGR